MRVATRVLWALQLSQERAHPTLHPFIQLEGCQTVEVVRVGLKEVTVLVCLLWLLELA